MGDDPKPRNETERMTPEDVERMSVAIRAQLRRDKAEAGRTDDRVPFRPAPVEVMIKLYDGTADEILALLVLSPRGHQSGWTLPSYLKKRLADAGASINAVPKDEYSKVYSGLRKAVLESKQVLDRYIKEELDPFVERMAGLYKESPEEIKSRSEYSLEKATYWKLDYYHMSAEMVNYVEDRLCILGVGDLDAIRIAEKIIAYFQNPDRYPNAPADRRQVDLVIDLILSASVSDFNRAASLKLPPRAPAVWSRREDRKEGENVVQFLERVWGRYIAAGVLYQDDIKRLGDPKLVASVRAYCHQHGLDAASVLPPPKRVRLERALAEVEPDSPAAILLRERMRHRQTMARRRRGQRVAEPN